MHFPRSFLEEIQIRLPVSRVVRRRVELVEAGRGGGCRKWEGRSPFKTEETPTFLVDDEKKAWVDLSSGRNGNIFDFVMATEGLSFAEAVQWLAAEAGLPPPNYYGCGRG